MKRRLVTVINGKTMQTLFVTSILIVSTFIVLSTQFQQVHGAYSSVEVVSDTPEFGPENVTGQEFTIEVFVKNVTDLYGIDLHLGWNTEYLEYVSHTAKIPVQDYPDGILYEPGVMVKDEVNTTAGTYQVVYASMAPAPSFNGTGKAFNMTFRIIDQPQYPQPDEKLFYWKSTDLADSSGNPLPGGWTENDGTVILHAITYEYPPRPLLKVVPESVTVSTGEQFNSSIYVMGEDGGDLDPWWDVGGFDVYVNFKRQDPPYLIMEALSIEIDPDGSFEAFWPGGILEVEKTIDNTEGWVHIAFLGLPGANGNHTAPYGNFRILSVIFNATYQDSQITANITLKNPRSFVHRMTLDADAGIINLASPEGTSWTAIDSFDFGENYTLTDWTDEDGDGQLSPSDEIKLNNTSSGKWNRYEMNNIKGTLGPMEQQPFPAVDDYVWAASFGPDGLGNNGLPGRYVGTDDPYNGFGVPYWTGNFSLTYAIDSVNQINVTYLPFTPDNYTVTLTEGVHYQVHADEDLVELLKPVDVNITNECWQDGVNNTLNGWPLINYVASSIQEVYVDMHNGTARPSPNAGYANDYTYGEWWYDPDWPWELEGWWALGYYPGPWNWLENSTWWINYTAASYLTIDYNAEASPEPFYMEFNGTYSDFLALGDPVGSSWDEVYPNSLHTWSCIDWSDEDTSGDITTGDYLTLEGTVGNRTYLVNGKSTDIIVDQILTVDDTDQRSPFYGEEIIVGVAGFPHSERAHSPWHNRDSSVPLPHEVEDASVIIPEFPAALALMFTLMVATIIVLLAKPRPTKTKDGTSPKQ